MTDRALYLDRSYRALKAEMEDRGCTVTADWFPDSDSCILHAEMGRESARIELKARESFGRNGDSHFMHCRARVVAPPDGPSWNETKRRSKLDHGEIAGQVVGMLERLAEAKGRIATILGEACGLGPGTLAAEPIPPWGFEGPRYDVKLGRLTEAQLRAVVMALAGQEKDDE